MIRTFKHKALEDFHRRGQARGLQQSHIKRLRGILAFLEAAKVISDMALPNFRLHPLKGDLDGYWAVWLDANYRVVFRFEMGDAYDVNVIDYH